MSVVIGSRTFPLNLDAETQLSGWSAAEGNGERWTTVEAIVPMSMDLRHWRIAVFEVQVVATGHYVATADTIFTPVMQVA